MLFKVSTAKILQIQSFQIGLIILCDCSYLVLQILSNDFRFAKANYPQTFSFKLF